MHSEWMCDTRYRWINKHNDHVYEAFAHKDLFGQFVVCTFNGGKLRTMVRKIYPVESKAAALSKLAKIHRDRRVNKEGGYQFLGIQHI